MSHPTRIAVVGGGAAGLACAVRAAYLARKHCEGSAEIALFERDPKVGRPILRSGNGRCNLSNALLDVGAYHNAAFVADVLAAAQESCIDEVETCGQLAGKRPADEAFFLNRGLLLREEGEGRLYPYPNKASVVLDLLRASLDACEVDVQVDARAAKLVARSASAVESGAARRFALHLDDGRVQHFDSVVCAVGGAAASAFASAVEVEGAGSAVAAGLIELKDQVPVLSPIAVSSKAVRKLDNIRVKCAVSLVRRGSVAATERGEVLFRKYGVSGIAVFNLSRFAESGDVLRMDLMPDVDLADLERLLAARIAAFKEFFSSRPTNARTLDGLLLPLVGEAVLRNAGLSPDSPCADAPLLASALKSFELSVEGLAEQDKAQVHRGGVSVDSVDPQTLESASIPGLFFVGEALDVDGPCGGYNLHFAWMSGLLAAGSAVDSLRASMHGSMALGGRGAHGGERSCGRDGVSRR